MFHILCPLETQENFRFSGIFRGYEMGTMTRHGLTGRILREFHTV